MAGIDRDKVRKLRERDGEVSSRKMCDVGSRCTRVGQPHPYGVLTLLAAEGCKKEQESDVDAEPHCAQSLL